MRSELYMHAVRFTSFYPKRDYYKSIFVLNNDIRRLVELCFAILGELFHVNTEGSSETSTAS